MHSQLPPIYYIVFTAITAFAVLLQALVLLAIFFAMLKSMQKLHGLLDEIKGKALPVLSTTQSLLEDVSPKLKIATTNLTEVSHTLRHQANHVNETVELLLDKTNDQIGRVDEMVTATLDALNQASRAVETAVALPARRVSSVIQGVRAGMGVLLGKKSHSSPNGTSGVGTPEKAAEQRPA
jgi:predicted transcriptional regulator